MLVTTVKLAKGRLARRCWVLACAVALAGCTGGAPRGDLAASSAALAAADPVKLANRLTWGVNSAAVQQVETLGPVGFVEAQLRPAAQPVLPAPIQAQIDAMTLTQTPVTSQAVSLAQQRREAERMPVGDARQAALQAHGQAQATLAREAAIRSLLRDLYSPDQLQEQLVWFWLNHFNLHQAKDNIRVTVGDFEDQAVRPHALGHFRDLLRATVWHPAMLTYLDNEHNAVGHINENYARELLELHTMGVGSGYSQRDVQELARVLTGMGVNYSGESPKVRAALQAQYVHLGLFEFNPNRHDYGDKMFLGAPIKGRGMAEVDEVIDRLCRHPATARFVSTKLATYFMGQAPSAALVARMAATFQRSEGDIAQVLRTLFYSPEFVQSLDHGFKDPMHYVVSAVRLAYDDKPILNANPMLYWLNRMGEPLYGHQTPDGYALTPAAWTGPGQMATRFEIAKAIGTGSAGLFRIEGAQPQDRPAFPQLANALYYRALKRQMSPATLAVLDQSVSPQEWNTLFLAAPEMMRR